ncbi:MAG: PUA domain-containing protein [Promethearchaeota archaeon]
MSINYLLGLRKAKAICDYQFGPNITDILFRNEEDIRLERSKNTDKIRYIYIKDKLLLTLRPNNGFFTLSFFSAKKIIKNTTPPKLRAIVLTEISEFIKQGRNVFCKHIINIDENLRPMDEVIIVDQNDELLAIGRLKIPIAYVKTFKNGVAINVRKGINKSKG